MSKTLSKLSFEFYDLEFFMPTSWFPWFWGKEEFWTLRCFRELWFTSHRWVRISQIIYQAHNAFMLELGLPMPLTYASAHPVYREIGCTSCQLSSSDLITNEMQQNAKRTLLLQWLSHYLFFLLTISSSCFISMTRRCDIKTGCLH